MRKPGLVEEAFRKSRHVRKIFLLQGEKARMRAGFKNVLPFKSKPESEK
jgi:hypothetical protein